MDVEVTTPLDVTTSVTQGLTANLSISMPSSMVEVTQSPLVAAVLEQPVVNVLVVGGPPGPPGPAGSGALNLTGQYPIFYDAGSGVVGIVSGYYVTFPDLTSASGALVAQISAAAAGVNAINGISGFVTLAAVNPLYVSAQGQTLYISGSGLATSGDINGINASISSLSGYTNTLVAATGQAAWAAAQNNATNLSGDLAATGSYLYNLITGNTGAAGSSTGVTSLNNLTNAVQLTGAGNVTVLVNGQAITVSGANSGEVSQAQLNSLSGYLTGSYLNTVVTYPQSIQSPVSFAEDLTIQDGRASTYIYSDSIGGVPTTGYLRIDGSFIDYYYSSGDIQYNNYRGLDMRNLSMFLIGSDDGITLDASRRILSGNWLADGGWTDPNSIVVNSGLWATGSLLYNLITGNTGYANLSGYITTGQADLRYYPLTSNPSGFITTGQTGQFYPASNPQAYATSGDVAATGQQAWTAANNNGINLSGNLQLTGSNLQSQINAITAVTGVIPGDIVFTSGTQFISGTKYFIGNTYIDNLFVTGSQTVIHSQDVYISDNWLVLNATGGARDSALFISTGFTGVSATGAVIGWDVPTNSWRFGLASQQTDLMTLPRIASGEAVDNLSARLEQTGSYLYQTITGQSGQALTDYATKIQLTNTGVALGAKIDALSGFVGQVSGGLEASIFQTGAAAIGHTNAVGVTLSGDLTQTGSLLSAVRITGSNVMNVPDFTGAGAVTVWSSGNRVYISGDSSDAANLSGVIAETGATLYRLVTGMSGQAVTDYATKTQLTLSGQTLDNKINTVSGWTTTIVSGGLEIRITATGQAAIDYARGIGVNLSGNLGATGSNLHVMLTNMSGAFDGKLYATGAALSAVHVTGSSTLNNPNFTGIGSTLVIRSGEFVLVSGAAAGGDVTQAQLNSLSGYGESVYVHRTGNELVSGTKFFTTDVYITGTFNRNTQYGQSQIRYTNNNGLATSLDFESEWFRRTNSQVTLSYGRQYLAEGALGRTTLNWSGCFLVNPDNNISANWKTGWLSGEWKTNATGIESGSLINYHRLSGLNTYAENTYVHRTGNELISGNKTFEQIAISDSWPVYLGNKSSSIEQRSNTMTVIGSSNTGTFSGIGNTIVGYNNRFYPDQTISSNGSNISILGDSNNFSSTGGSNTFVTMVGRLNSFTSETGLANSSWSVFGRGNVVLIKSGVGNSLGAIMGDSNRFEVRTGSNNSANVIVGRANTIRINNSTNSQANSIWGLSNTIDVISGNSASANYVMGVSNQIGLPSGGERNNIFGNNNILTGTSFMTLLGNYLVSDISTGVKIGVGDKYLQIQSGASSATFNNLNVGIGVSNPNFNLHVSGTVGFSGITTSTTANVGAATLPANPVGFITINITGGNFKIPYYNV